MGNFRVFKKSVRFTFRSKRRFFVFLMIFGIVSTFIAFYIDTLDDMRTDGILEQKGVSMYQEDSKTVTYAQGTKILSDILLIEDSDDDIKIETSIIFHYAELDPYIRLYSMDIHHPWYSEFVKPSLVSAGEYPTSKSHILVPSGSKQIYNSSSTGVVVDTEIAVGQLFTFEKAGSDPIELRVSGKFDSSQIQEQGDEDRLWIFADKSKFESLLKLFGKTTADAYTYSITFVVPGNIISRGANKLVTALNTQIKGLLKENRIGEHGDWEPQPDSLPTDKAEDEAIQNWANLLFVVLGGIILTTMFAYLISRFRRREIAILKAMGYAQSSVRTTLMAEILTIAFVGFIFGVSMAQGLLFYLSDFSTTSLLSKESVLVSFGITVIVTLPGMLLVSWRVLQVSPSEAFRGL
ncbi:MAG: hypothetical protein HeimC2_03750 [Candidatus Heimdallarchaeota archaeon LC_2]|nr:MAG: hypothetical protein HeimC2_03750 [Candidatus Heimdallarchaeota archaeon LC_2]